MFFCKCGVGGSRRKYGKEKGRHILPEKTKALFKHILGEGVLICILCFFVSGRVFGRSFSVFGVWSVLTAAVFFCSQFGPCFGSGVFFCLREVFFCLPAAFFCSTGVPPETKNRARPVAVLSCVPLFGRFRIVFARSFLYSVRGRFSPWRSSSVSGLACDLDPAVFIFLSGRVFNLCPIFSCFTGAPQETKKEEPGFFVAPFVCPGVFFLAPVGCFFSCSSRKLQPRKESRCAMNMHMSLLCVQDFVGGDSPQTLLPRSGRYLKVPLGTGGKAEKRYGTQNEGVLIVSLWVERANVLATGTGLGRRRANKSNRIKAARKQK